MGEGGWTLLVKDVQACAYHRVFLFYPLFFLAFSIITIFPLCIQLFFYCYDIQISVHAIYRRFDIRCLVSIAWLVDSLYATNYRYGCLMITSYGGGPSSSPLPSSADLLISCRRKSVNSSILRPLLRVRASMGTMLCWCAGAFRVATG